jgi:hypothetical protein
MRARAFHRLMIQPLGLDLEAGRNRLAVLPLNANHVQRVVVIVGPVLNLHVPAHGVDELLRGLLGEVVFPRNVDSGGTVARLKQIIFQRRPFV